MTATAGTRRTQEMLLVDGLDVTLHLRNRILDRSTFVDHLGNRLPDRVRDLVALGGRKPHGRLRKLTLEDLVLAYMSQAMSTRQVLEPTR